MPLIAIIFLHRNSNSSGVPSSTRHSKECQRMESNSLERSPLKSIKDLRFKFHLWEFRVTFSLFVGKRRDLDLKRKKIWLVLFSSNTFLKSISEINSYVLPFSIKKISLWGCRRKKFHKKIKDEGRTLIKMSMKWKISNQLSHLIFQFLIQSIYFGLFWVCSPIYNA